MRRTMSLAAAALVAPFAPPAPAPSPSGVLGTGDAEQRYPYVAERSPAAHATRPAPSPDRSRRVTWLTVTASPGKDRRERATFGLTLAGTLAISVPTAVSLGTSAAGGTLTGRLGTVTVDDSRTSGAGPWTATVSSTDYTRTTPPTSTIARADMYYWSGPATATQGGGTFTPGQPTAGQIVSLGTPRTAFSHSKSTGQNRCSWNPTLQLNIPGNAAAGDYTGVITHSVA